MNKSFINKYCRKFGFEVHGTGYIQALKKSSFKDDQFAKQKELIKEKKPVIFDVGANRGDISYKYLELFPDARIFAFEPFPQTFSVLRDRFINNQAVHHFNIALSNTSGTKQFYVNNNVDTNSLLKPQKTGLSSDSQVKNDSIIQVRSTTLDQFTLENDIKSIDILKMDVQGGEFSILLGATRLLQEGRIKCIYSEVYFLEQYEAQPLFHDISKLLYKYGFLLQDIYSPIYGNGSLAWGDAIFTLQKK